MNAEVTYKIGDLVKVRDEFARQMHRGQVYRVTKTLKVNILVEPIGGGRSMRGNPELFEPAPESTAAAVERTPFLPLLSPGEVVTVAGPGWKQPADRYYVVIHQGNDQKVKIAELGGDGGRYWPSVPRTMITVVNRARILVVRENENE